MKPPRTCQAAQQADRTQPNHTVPHLDCKPVQLDGACVWLGKRLHSVIAKEGGRRRLNSLAAQHDPRKHRWRCNWRRHSLRCQLWVLASHGGWVRSQLEGWRGLLGWHGLAVSRGLVEHRVQKRTPALLLELRSKGRCAGGSNALEGAPAGLDWVTRNGLLCGSCRLAQVASGQRMHMQACASSLWM